MPDSIQNLGFGDVSLAQDVIEAYAEDTKGLTSVECGKFGIDGKGCYSLMRALDRERGEITKYDRTDLEAAGFSKEFIDTLAGKDGMRALNARIKWFGDNCVKKWWKVWISEDEREEMIIELGYIGPAAKYAAPAIAEVLEKEIKINSYTNAERTLGEIGIVSDEVTDRVKKIFNNVIIPAMQGPDLTNRWSAFGKVSNLGPYSKFVIPQLIKGLKSENRNIRHRATWALRNAGSDAKEAVPVIIELLFRRTLYGGFELEEEETAIFAIDKIGPSENDISMLILKLSDKDSFIRYKAIKALNQLGTRAFMAVPILDDMKDNDPKAECRKAAGKALQRILDDTR